MRPRIVMVDVFAERAYRGNPLAVVTGAEGMPDETMQRLAAEVNFSETTFVAPSAGDRHRVRIFTPAREIAFAGHPILGTAWVIRHRAAPGVEGPVCLDLAVGRVPVTFERAADGAEILWFLAPPVTLGPTCPPEAIAAALGLSPRDIDDRSPVRQVSAGTSAMIVPLRGLDALQRATLDLAAFAPLAGRGFPPLVYLFCRETRDAANDFCARFFFEANGVREDPATGNGAAFLGHYLLEHAGEGVPDRVLRIEQGHALGRPSLVLLRARVAGGAREVGVGGSVVPTIEGELL